MPYHHVDPTDLPAAPDRPSTKRSISDAAGLEQFAAHLYEVAPGEAIPLAYHVHDEQEELFFVASGTLAVETPEETYEVREGCFFAVDPGSPQRAYNPVDADEPVTVVAIGTPPVSGDAHAYDPDSDAADDSAEHGRS